MKPNPAIFEFTSYNLNSENRKALFNYRVKFTNKKPVNFTETVVFPAPFVINDIPRKLIRELLSNLHIILGISYYKLYCPSKLKLNVILSEKQADFWNTVYRKGLGEFFYRNNIDPKNLIKFPYDSKKKLSPHKLIRKNRALAGIGGGKDSVVVGELLKEQKADFSAFVVETQTKDPIAERVVREMKIGSLVVQRYLDEKIFESFPGGYKGHIPISAIFAFLGYFCAVVYDYQYVIAGNEFSSNFGNIKCKGWEVNHQWSKSLEFEMLFQDYAKNFLSPNIIYFSLLRPFYEIRIAEIFSRHQNYFPIFASCNRNFRIHKERPKTLWCGKCPKCVFVWTILSAFLNKKELIKIFGRNLYEDEKLLSLFADILGYGKMKPFDCVGTFDEAQAAVFLAKDKFRNSFILKKFLSQINNPKKLIKRVFSVNSSSIMPPAFKFLGIKNVLILGYGKEGMITKRYIEKFYPKIEIGIADQKSGKNYLEKQKDFDLAVKTPGIAKKMVNMPYTTATNLFFSQIKNMTIGVTGSKGKSTTASLIHSILKEAGIKTSLLGNIGNPMLTALEKPIDKDEIFVIELSSYQLDDIEYSPNVAVALNLFPEHMNYHGSAGRYYNAKKNIIKFQNTWDYFVYNGNDQELKKWAKKAKAKTIFFNKKINLPGGEFSLIGKHNEKNIQAAVAVARLLKIPRKTIQKAIQKFRPLPHRLEFVGEFNNIKFYDDAISTTPESTIAALESIADVKTIMLGGEDRGYDFSELRRQLKKHEVKNIVLFPDSGRKILSSDKFFKILRTENMKKAVRFAYQYTPDGSTCLLSTASPSYSLWKNFEEKGNLFQKCVKSLSKKQC